MPMSEINQPDFICVDENLRLRKYDEDCAFALDWYQDEEILLMVDGKYQPYDLDRLYQMYEYLQKHGEVYFRMFEKCGFFSLVKLKKGIVTGNLSRYNISENISFTFNIQTTSLWLLPNKCFCQLINIAG